MTLHIFNVNPKYTLVLLHIMYSIDIYMSRMLESYKTKELASERKFKFSVKH
jgi:hypothetical protein